MSSILQRIRGFGQGERLRSQLVRGAFGVGGFRLLSLPLTLTVSILLARELEPEGYGQYAFVMALVTLLSIPVSGGMGELLVREIAKFRASQSWLLLRGAVFRSHQFVGLSSATVVIITTFAAIYSPAGETGYFWLLLGAGSLMLPLIGAAQIRVALLRGMEKPTLAVLPESVVKPIVMVISVALLTFMNWLSPLSAVIGNIIATLCATIVGIYLVKKYGHLDVAGAPRSFRTKIWLSSLPPFMFLAFVGTAHSKIGIILLGFLSNDASVGIFQIALTASLVFGLPRKIIGQLIAPIISRLSSSGDLPALSSLTRSSTRFALLFTIPPIIVLLLFGEKLINLVLGAGYEDVYPLLLIFMAAEMIKCITGYVGEILNMSGYEKTTSTAYLASGLGSIVLIGGMIPVIGVLGAAIGQAIMIVMLHLYLAIKVRSKTGVSPWVF